jgi:hypothetical protein
VKDYAVKRDLAFVVRCLCPCPPEVYMSPLDLGLDLSQLQYRHHKGRDHIVTSCQRTQSFMSTYQPARQTLYTARPYTRFNPGDDTLYMGLRPVVNRETKTDGTRRFQTDDSGSVRYLAPNPNRATVLLEDWIQSLTPDNLKALRSNDPDMMWELMRAIETSYIHEEDREIGLDLSKSCNVRGISLDLSCLGGPPHPGLILPEKTGWYKPLTSPSCVRAKIQTQLSKKNSTRRISKIEITLPGAVKRRTGELATFKPKTVQSFADDLSKYIPLVLDKRLAWVKKNPRNNDERKTAEETIETLVRARLERLQHWGVDDRGVDLAPEGELYEQKSTPVTMHLTEDMGDTQLIITAEHDGRTEPEDTATAGGASR